jgi:hypothetical protein
MVDCWGVRCGGHFLFGGRLDYRRRLEEYGMTKLLTLKEMHEYGKELAEQVAKEMSSEPVAWMWDVYNGAGYSSRGIGFQQTDIPFAKHTPLYTAPQEREWKSLTSAQMKALWVAAEKKPSVFAGMIETKLKELNHD